ncbi:hypothetical protein FSP39_013096 [Pinctada imbricata]|uniref:Uncharacterized protein n=1 Tax=Pinctada imbricata TaxID=66713 RepID=A0AA88XYS3_PINIB|nr:hypothetical protein FSP39_013096 [Pinctada imbricata]
MITPTRARNIVEYRDKNGQFDNLSEFLNIPGLGPIALTNICTELKSVDPVTLLDTKEKRGDATLQCSPRMTAINAQRFHTVCSVCVYNDIITYSHLDRQLYLMDWNQSVLFDKPTIKYDHLLYHEKIFDVVQGLPKADAYVMEEKRQKFTSLYAAKYQANSMVLFSMLATLINKDYPYTDNKVYMVNDQAINRVFEMGVGSERMSCIDFVKQGFQGEGILGDVKFPVEMMKKFTHANETEQFLLGSALIINLGFYKYCVLSKYS